MTFSLASSENIIAPAAQARAQKLREFPKCTAFWLKWTTAEMRTLSAQFP